MPIVSLESEHVSSLYQLYLRAVERVAHCRFLPSVDLFRARLLERQQAGTRLFVSVDQDNVQGLAALLDLPSSDDGAGEAAVTALLFTRDSVGQSLLTTCVQEASAADVRRLKAFPNSHDRCPIPAYNSGWDGLSDCMPVVGRALIKAGFVPFYRELHLACDFEHFPPQPTLQPLGITIRTERDARDQTVLRVLVDDREMGICVYSTLAHVSDNPAAARWGYIAWLMVDQHLRRQGIARHLLTRALTQLHQHGCTGCWLTTGADNWSAQPLYLGLGFEIVDASACFVQLLA